MSKQFCKRGHDTLKVGRDKSGRCRECNRMRQRQYDHEGPKVKEAKKIKKQKRIEEALKTGTKVCSKCKIEKPLEQFSIDKRRFLGVSSYCNICKNRLKKLSKSKKPEFYKQQALKYFYDHHDKCLRRGKTWRLNHPEIVAAKAREWAKNNPAKRSNSEAKRRQRGNNIKFGQNGIVEFYKKCPTNMEVDHFIPLKGKLVSGLHVIWNLQYLAPKENRVKLNKVNLKEINSWYENLLKEAGIKD